MTIELNTSLVCAEFGSSRQKEVMDLNVQNMRNVIDKCHGLVIVVIIIIRFRKCQSNYRSSVTYRDNYPYIYNNYSIN